jgi:cytochrome P450 family 142 subfamily A polypeptide 1
MDANVDYLDSGSWDARMHDRLRWLRENDPVYWAEKSQCWLITKFHDVAQISKNQDLFTSAQGVRANSPLKIGLIDDPEPHHTHVRKLINKGFTPRMVKKLEITFRQLVKETLDAVAQSGECDFVEDIAVPLPLLLIAEMIGIRKQDRARFHQWSDAMIAGDGNLHRPEIIQKAGAAYVEYFKYVVEILEDRRKNPKDDLVSILVGAKDAGLLNEREVPEGLFDSSLDQEDLKLANDELIKLMVVLLVAGNETTRNAISGGMQLLIENPEARAQLVRDPAKIPMAIEEMLRLVSPVHSFSRTLTRDTELRGKRLLEGQKVLLVYPSANRDAEVFPEPDRFVIDRNPQHLAFGVGPHFCLGANLARMEMAIAFGELLRRFPDMTYSAGGPEIRPSALVRSCVHMHVRYTPERSAA